VPNCVVSVKLYEGSCRLCYREAKYVLAGLISGTGPGSNPGLGAKLGQVRML